MNDLGSPKKWQLMQKRNESTGMHDLVRII